MNDVEKTAVFLWIFMDNHEKVEVCAISMPVLCLKQDKKTTSFRRVVKKTADFI